MIYAEKGNKVCTITEFDIQAYLDRGFNIVNTESGEKFEAIPTDPAVLRKAYIDHTAEIAALKAEIAALKDTPKVAPVKKSTQAAAPAVEEIPEVATVTTRKKTSK